MKRKTVLIDSQDLVNQVKALFNLSNQEMSELVAQAKKFDPNKTGSVSKTEVDDIMRELNLLPQNRPGNEKVYDYFEDQLREYQANFLDLRQICDLYCKMKRLQEQMKDEETITQEYIDAFVALGGQSDKTGSVLKQTIIDVIVNEFELNIDIDIFLGDFGRDSLNFDEFCQLFENAGDDAKSVITSKSRKSTANNGQKVQVEGDFTVKFRDFERWEKSTQ